MAWLTGIRRWLAIVAAANVLVVYREGRDVMTTVSFFAGDRRTGARSDPGGSFASSPQEGLDVAILDELREFQSSHSPDPDPAPHADGDGDHQAVVVKDSPEQPSEQSEQQPPERSQQQRSLHMDVLLVSSGKSERLVQFVRDLGDCIRQYRGMGSSNSNNSRYNPIPTISTFRLLVTNYNASYDDEEYRNEILEWVGAGSPLQQVMVVQGQGSFSISASRNLLLDRACHETRCLACGLDVDMLVTPRHFTNAVETVMLQQPGHGGGGEGVQVYNGELLQRTPDPTASTRSSSSSVVYFPIVFNTFHPESVKMVERYYQCKNRTVDMFTSRNHGYWNVRAAGIYVLRGDDAAVLRFDTSITAWGPEDVRFFDLVLKERRVAVRRYDRGLIHTWHDKDCNNMNIQTAADLDSCRMTREGNMGSVLGKALLKREVDMEYICQPPPSSSIAKTIGNMNDESTSPMLRRRRGPRNEREENGGGGVVDAGADPSDPSRHAHMDILVPSAGRTERLEEFVRDLRRSIAEYRSSNKIVVGDANSTATIPPTISSFRLMVTNFNQSLDNFAYQQDLIQLSGSESGLDEVVVVSGDGPFSPSKARNALLDRACHHPTCLAFTVDEDIDIRPDFFVNAIQYVVLKQRTDRPGVDVVSVEPFEADTTGVVYSPFSFGHYKSTDLVHQYYTCTTRKEQEEDGESFDPYSKDFGYWRWNRSGLYVLRGDTAAYLRFDTNLNWGEEDTRFYELCLRENVAVVSGMEYNLIHRWSADGDCDNKGQLSDDKLRKCQKSQSGTQLGRQLLSRKIKLEDVCAVERQ